MPLPKVVQDIAAASEAAFNANQQRLNPQLPVAQAPEVPATPVVPATPAAPAAQPAAAAQPTAQPPAAAPTPPVAPAEDASLQSRFSVLQGKYNAEVPRLAAQVRELERDVEERDRVISELREKLKTAAPTVRPEEVAEYGEGMIDVMRRVVKEATDPLNDVIQRQASEITRLKGGVETRQKLGFYDILNRDHNDWAAVNGDSAFHQFLDTKPPGVTRTYQELLSAAQDAQDGEAASAVFTAFKKARDSLAASAAASLATQVVPPQGAPAPAPVNTTPTPQARIITRAEVQAHYTKARQGRYASQAEANAAEAEIQRALAEGRIQ